MSGSIPMEKVEEGEEEEEVDSDGVDDVGVEDEETLVWVMSPEAPVVVVIVVLSRLRIRSVTATGSSPA